MASHCIQNKIQSPQHILQGLTSVFPHFLSLSYTTILLLLPIQPHVSSRTTNMATSFSLEGLCGCWSSTWNILPTLCIKSLSSSFSNHFKYFSERSYTHTYTHLITLNTIITCCSIFLFSMRDMQTSNYVCAVCSCLPST